MDSTLNKVKDWRERGYHMRTPPLTIISYDPAADGEDNDAVSIVTREEHQRGEEWDPDFAVQTLFRVVGATYMPPDYEFPDKVAACLKLYRDAIKWKNSGRSAGTLITVESNGIGYGLVGALKEKIADSVVPYTTVGTTTNKAFGENGIIMPRLTALSHLKMLMEQHYVRAAKGAFGMKKLEGELNAFVWAGPKRPEALPGQRDDMVMSLCGAVWIGSKVVGPMLKQRKYRN